MKAGTYVFTDFYGGEHLFHVFSDPFTPKEEEVTEYVILASTEGKWAEAAQVAARSGQSAIRAHIEERQEGNHALNSAFVAVPARSWKPVTVKVETKTALKFS